MTVKRTLKTPGSDQFADIVPLPDPPRIPDMQQNKHITRADQTLDTWFRRISGTLVNGQGYLCPDRDNIRRSPYPNCLVAFDVDPERITATNGYVISEVGKPPEFVLEVASSTTGRRDYTIKREQYAALGVGEYWRFDHTGGQYHDAALAGDRLVNGVYERITVTTESDGLIWGHCETLGLDLCWRNNELLFRDPSTGEFLLNQLQAQDALEYAEAARRDAEARLSQLEEELRRRQEQE
jgi:hypothetical protein